MIVDTFMFSGLGVDADILELRLHELNDVVDLFVFAEATRTHSGQIKPLYYTQYEPRFEAFAAKIRYLPIYDLPVHASPSSRENIHRAMLYRGLVDVPEDAWILVSDLDEIPHPDAVQFCSQQTDNVFMFEQRLSYYYANCVSASTWHGTRMLRKRHITTLHTVRFATGAVVKPGGWHMSYLGGTKAIQQKISAYLHQEHNTVQNVDASHIEQCIQNGVDLFGRQNETYTFQPIDGTYPRTMQRYPDKFVSWIAPL